MVTAVAIRQVRFHVKTGDKKIDRKINREIHDPFFWYMDTLMRGRFKLYSGEEVKGTVLVNYSVYSKSYIDMYQEHSGRIFKLNEWTKSLNTLDLDTEIALEELTGTRADKVGRALDMFSQSAASSDFPQLRLMARHIGDSNKKQAIEEAIKKSDNKVGIVTKIYDKFS